jgi:hypothetical protein
MICPDCGTPIAPAALFCRHRGRRIEARSPTD